MPDQASTVSPRRFPEHLAGILLLALALLPRLILTYKFPTIPFSDFANLVAFGQQIRDHGFTSGWWFWQGFHPGLPVALSLFFRLYPCCDPGSVARVGTRSE